MVLALVEHRLGRPAALISGDIVSALLARRSRSSIIGIIIYYLNTPAVKTAFGKTAA